MLRYHEKLKIRKWSKIHNDLRDKIKNQMHTGKRYSDILDMIPYAQISKMVISRIYKNCDEKLLIENRKIMTLPGAVLYINTDDGFIATKKDDTRCKERFRVFSFNTGFDWKQSTKSRFKLKEKRTFFVNTGEKESIDTAEFAKKIIEIGRQNYKNFDELKIILGGDGATWIKSTASMIGAKFVLDRYHAINYLKKVYLTGRKRFSKEWHMLFRTAKELFIEGEYECLMEMLKLEAPKEIIRYFKSNKIGVLNQAMDDFIGVSAETDISRLLKSTMGYGSKVYNQKTLINIITKKANFLNGIM